MNWPAGFEKWFQDNLNKIKGQYFIEWDAKTRQGKPPVVRLKKRKGKKHPPAKKTETPYNLYIESEVWKLKSRKFRAEVGKCELCGTLEGLQCHHKHYRTMGNETRKDIMVVCYPCHCKIHGVTSFKNRKIN